MNVARGVLVERETSPSTRWECCCSVVGLLAYCGGGGRGRRARPRRRRSTWVQLLLLRMYSNRRRHCHCHCATRPTYTRYWATQHVVVYWCGDDDVRSATALAARTGPPPGFRVINATLPRGARRPPTAVQKSATVESWPFFFFFSIRSSSAACSSCTPPPRRCCVLVCTTRTCVFNDSSSAILLPGRRMTCDGRRPSCARQKEPARFASYCVFRVFVENGPSFPSREMERCAMAEERNTRLRIHAGRWTDVDLGRGVHTSL